MPIVAEIPRPDGKGPPLRLTGQIDRLVRIGNRVMIVDYKTNRPPPPKWSKASRRPTSTSWPPIGLQSPQIFTGCQVSAAILWTDGARIMSIPDQLLDTYAGKLWTLDPATLDARDRTT